MGKKTLTLVLDWTALISDQLKHAQIKCETGKEFKWERTDPVGSDIAITYRCGGIESIISIALSNPHLFWWSVYHSACISFSVHLTELFVKVVHAFQAFSIFTKNSILCISLGSENASASLLPPDLFLSSMNTKNTIMNTPTIYYIVTGIYIRRYYFWGFISL